MTRSTKFVFFLIALFTMASFAVASVAMAVNKPWWALLLFVLAIVLTGCGFVARRRFIGQTQPR